MTDIVAAGALVGFLWWAVTRKDESNLPERRNPKTKPRKRGAKCAPGQIKVNRRGFTRSDGARVSSATFCIDDPGQPERDAFGSKSGPRRAALGYEPWIKNKDVLGQGFLKDMSEAERRDAMASAYRRIAAENYAAGRDRGLTRAEAGSLAYQGLLGRLQALSRSTALKRRYGGKLKRARDWLVASFGGKGSLISKKRKAELRRKGVLAKSGTTVLPERRRNPLGERRQYWALAVNGGMTPLGRFRDPSMAYRVFVREFGREPEPGEIDSSRIRPGEPEPKAPPDLFDMYELVLPRRRNGGQMQMDGSEFGDWSGSAESKGAVPTKDEADEKLRDLGLDPDAMEENVAHEVHGMIREARRLRGLVTPGDVERALGVDQLMPHERSQLRRALRELFG